MDEKNSNLRHDENDPHHGDDSMVGMMAMMMAMCLGVILLFSVLSAVGLLPGILIAVGAGAVMLVLHDRFMRHGGH